MKKSGFKLRSGNSPMKQNIFKDFKKEMSDNPITRSKAWKKTKSARQVAKKWGGRLFNIGTAFEAGATGFWGALDTWKYQGFKHTDLGKTVKKINTPMTEEQKKQHKKNYQNATESYSTPKW